MKLQLINYTRDRKTVAAAARLCYSDSMGQLCKIAQSKSSQIRLYAMGHLSPFEHETYIQHEGVVPCPIAG